MARTIRLHLDENRNPAIAAGLRARGVDVTTTQDVGLLAAIDQRQMDFAPIHRRVLVSHDADMIALHDKGTPHHGIIFSRMGRRSIGQMIDAIVLTWEIYEPDEMIGRLEYI